MHAPKTENHMWLVVQTFLSLLVYIHYVSHVSSGCLHEIRIYFIPVALSLLFKYVRKSTQLSLINCIPFMNLQVAKIDIMDSVDDELTGDFHDTIEAIGMIVYTYQIYYC